MDVYLFSALFILGIILLLIMFFKKQVIIGIFSGVCFVILGVLLWNGLSSIVGYTEYKLAPCNNNCTEIRAGNEVNLYEVTNTTVTYIYGESTSNFNEDMSYSDVAAIFFVMLGLFLLFVNASLALSGKKSIDFTSDEEE